MKFVCVVHVFRVFHVHVLCHVLLHVLLHALFYVLFHVMFHVFIRFLVSFLFLSTPRTGLTCASASRVPHSMAAPSVDYPGRLICRATPAASLSRHPTLHPSG